MHVMSATRLLRKCGPRLHAQGLRHGKGRYMFDVQNMHRLMAGYMPHNERSAGVLEHLGFVREGFAKDYLQINGKWKTIY